MANRVTQLPAEVVYDVDAQIRVTQLVVEVIGPCVADPPVEDEPVLPPNQPVRSGRGLYVYLGEENRGRLVRIAGQLHTQVTTEDDPGFEPVLLAFETWDLWPAGAGGDNVLRMVVLTLKASNGFNVRVTPYVDEQEQPAQTFSRSGSGVFVLDTWVAKRGARIAAKVEQLAPRNGELEVIDLTVGHVSIRPLP